MRRSLSLAVLVCGLAGAATGEAATRAGAPAAAAAAPRTLTVEDAFRLRDVGAPRLSPDGGWVAYTVTSRDLEEDEAESRVWMASTDGGEPLAMTAPGSSASRPRWSPDGRYLSFLAARDGDESQVWALDRRGGEAARLTAVEQGVSAYEWSPDGRRLVLVIEDPEPDASGDEESDEGCAEDEEDEEGKTPPPWVIDRLQIKVDEEGYLDRRREHLYLLAVGTDAEPLQITGGDFEDSQPAWSPDGRWIVFVSNRGEEPDATYDTELWVVSAAGSDEGGAESPDPAGAGAPGRPLRRLTSHPGADDSPVWSPDGRWIAYLTTPDPEYFFYASREVARVPAEGGEPLLLTAGLDRVPESPRFAADSSAVYFLLEDSGENQLARVPVGGGEVERLVGGRRVVEGLDPGAGGAVALLVSEPHRPPEVHLWANDELRRLTHTNDEVLSGLRLGEVERFETTSADGTVVQSFLVKPPDFVPGRRYPALLWIHGGPQSQYDWRFRLEPQLFAANGYLVLLPNPRGSTGRGQAFCLGIWRSWGEKDFEDVMAAVDWAVDRGLADAERLGVGGWSYGGMLTNQVITRTGRFKAAISGASATLYAANYGTDQYQRWWEQELGPPWEPASRELWERLSPFNRLDRVRTPTLILCGEKDWNVPVLNSEQLYQALRSLGKVETLLVVYPGESHTLSVPSYRKDRLERYLDWLDRYVKGEGGGR